MLRLRHLAAVALLFGGAALGQTPAFDFGRWKGDHAGPPTRVATLATDHLNEGPSPPTEQQLQPVLDRLARFNPDVITVEAMSGAQCEYLREQAARFTGVFARYCGHGRHANAALGLGVAEAIQRVDARLKDWPAAPTPAQRRALAGLFLAASDPFSALVQWQQLPPEERREGDGINSAMKSEMDTGLNGSSEIIQLAVKLAARLGHARVHAIDDHTADLILLRDWPAIERVFAGMDPVLPGTRAYQLVSEKLTRTGDYLTFFREMNSPRLLREIVKGDFGAPMRHKSDRLFGRQYLAWVEVRNMRMVANIRAAFAHKPGARVLNIVGASHKPYFDNYLSKVHEVQLVDVVRVMK